MSESTVGGQNEDARGRRSERRDEEEKSRVFSEAGPDAKLGLALTFATLGRSADPRVDAILAQALAELDARIQVHALETMLARRGDRTGLRDAIASLHLLSNPAVNFLVEHIDGVLPALRELAGSPQVQTRLNVVELASRPGQVRLAYLLVQGAQDPDDRVAERAMAALEKLTRRYHQQAEAARSGRVDLSHEELEARRFALIDPLLARLTPGRATAETGETASRPAPARPETTAKLLELSMGLDSRTDELLFRIYANAHDGRSRTVRTILASSSSAQVVSFAANMLRSRTTERSECGLGLLANRSDARFVRLLLATDCLFTDAVTRRTLKSLKRIPWLEPFAESADSEATGGRAQRPAPTDTDNVDVVGEGLSPLPREGASGAGEPGDAEITALLGEDAPAIRAIHLLLLSGAPMESILRGLSRRGPGRTAREFARTTLEALLAHRPVEQISMALMDAERLLEAESAKPNTPGEQAGGSLEWVQKGTRSLPEDAFRQFFENYDRLAPETKELASATLRRLDRDLDEQLKEALASVEAGVRLKALRIVTALAREREVEEVLLELMEDPDERVRATVVKTLGLVESETGVRAVLAAVRDLDRRVVANAVEAIEAAGFKQMVGLVRILAGHANNRIRANAVKALIQMHVPGGEERLAEMLASPSEMMRLSATWVLGEVRFVRAQIWLNKLATSDPSERVRQKAADILEGKR